MVAPEPVAVLNAATVEFTTAQVDAALDRMAEQITTRLAGVVPVVLAVMNGGMFTAADLCKRLRIPFEFDYVHATRYGQSTTGRSVEWRVAPDPSLRGRAVLVVDDVLDRGVTLAALVEQLSAIGVAHLSTAVLIRKHFEPPVARPAVDFVGLETGDRYLFGRGMDYKGFWRGLPEIYGIDP